MKKLILATVLFLALGGTGLDAFAQTGETDGEVRRVDRENGRITLRHGPIEGPLEMPAMSMVFQVKDATLLDRLQPGDRVHAQVLKEGGVFYILSATRKD